MHNIAIILFIFLSIQDVPFKPKEEFEIKLDYKFKQRPEVDRNRVNLDESRREYERRTSSSLLPYLILNLHVIKLVNGETKIRITNNLNKNVAVRKIEEGTMTPIDIGFTDDVKDRVTANQYDISFLSNDKKEHNKIIILIEEDGSFFVNGEKRGRF